MSEAELESARRDLLLQIARETAETESWTGRGRIAPAVMAALGRVPRHLFVAPFDRGRAYDNRPLVIGHGQTISQPFIVALMTELLDLQPGDRVLEIGTGCGYQTAVLAELAADVFSLEVLAELADSARARLARLGYLNVHVRHGDGFRGWPEEAPFDAIIVTAAPLAVPPALPAQLRPGGRLVIPVGPRGETQMLLRCVPGSGGALECARRLPVAFVPMIEGPERPGGGPDRRT